MTRSTLARSIVPALLMLLSATGCDRPAPQSQQTAQPVTTAPDTTLLYVDVRTAGEFAGSHVEGAVNIPHDRMSERWQELLPYRDRTIVLYCVSGKRSGIAEEVLREHGFTQVRNAGGLDDLVDAGVPVTEQ